MGNLGTVPLGGLAVGGGLLAWAAGLLNFLAYGTTARAARRAGAGDRAGAVSEGVQATWLAVGLGLAVLAVFQLLAGPLARTLAGGPGAVAEAGEQWLRIASLGVPLMLVSLAGNGWLRGVQELRRPVRYVLAGSLVSLVLCPLLVYPAGLGLAGSAIANVAGQAVAALLFVRALTRERVAWRPRTSAIRAQLVIGRDLLLRAVVLQVSFLVATGVVARADTASLGAHQIAVQLFFFLALVLDAYAIAAQTLVGQALGAGRPDDARAAARRVTWWGLARASPSAPSCWPSGRSCCRCSPTIPPSCSRRRWRGGSSPRCSRSPGSCSPWTASSWAPATSAICAPSPSGRR